MNAIEMPECTIGELVYQSLQKKMKFSINPIPGRGLFGPPPTSIGHSFSLVIAMKLKFSIASQLLIRKILPKHFLKNMGHYGIMM